MSAFKLTPQQREPGTGPNPSGDRAPVEKFSRAPKGEPAAAALPAEVAGSAPVATPEAAPAQPEAKKKKTTPKKKAPALASITPPENPPTTPEAKIGDEVTWESRGQRQWEGGKKITSIEKYEPTGEMIAIVEGVSTGIPLKELLVVTAAPLEPAPTAAAPSPEADPLHVPPDPDAPKPVARVIRPRVRLSGQPGSATPVVATTPEVAPAAGAAAPPPEAAPAAPTIPPRRAPRIAMPGESRPAPAAAPATPPETATTPPETPPTTTETAPAPPAPELKKGFFDSITSGFRSAADRFMARFRGEVTAQDEKKYEASWGDVSKNTAVGILSVAASYGGFKVIHDLPAWFYQKVFTNPAERERIRAAFKTKETELDTAGGGDDLEAKKQKLEEIINTSKFLTKEKKAELVQKLKDTIETRDAGVLLATEKRDQKMAELLDQAIQTRVKTSQMLKETLNFALVATGLLAARGVVYGAVSLGERYARLNQDPEFKKQKRDKGLDEKVGIINDLIIGGMQDTWKQLKGGGADTKMSKGLNAIQGASTVLRALGIGGLAYDEIMHEGVTDMIDASLKAWEEKSAAQFVGGNMWTPWDRLGALFGKASDAVVGASEAPTVSSGGDIGMSDSITGQELDAFGNPIDLGTSDSVTGQDLDASGEPTGAVAPIEYPESVIATGTVHKGDGIIEILQRQGLSAKEALAAARETGIVRPGGDTRLATEAIGRISILVHETDGHAVIEFRDVQTGNMFSLDEVRAQGFTYEHESGPSVSAPAEAGSVSNEPEPGALETATPEAERLFVNGHLTLNHSPAEGFSLSMHSLAPNETLLDMTDANAIDVDQAAITGQIESVKELSQKVTSEMAILEKLDRQGLGESSEAHLIRNDLIETAKSFTKQYPGILNESALTKIQHEVSAQVDKILPVTSEADRIADIRIPGLGKIEFTYDASGNPEFNFNQLIENAKPVLELRAQNMLVTGWQDTLAENYVTKQEMDVAEPVYLMNEALNQLNSAGDAESPEATFLKGKLTEFLRANANVLDGDNPIIKEAAEKAGVNTVIFSTSS